MGMDTLLVVTHDSGPSSHRVLSPRPWLREHTRQAGDHKSHDYSAESLLFVDRRGRAVKQ